MSNKIAFGNTDIQLVPLIFGGNVFGWTLDEEASFTILDQFLDLGFNAIDTANNYSHWVPGNQGGESENIIGNWLDARKNRDQVVLMTKVGGRFGYDTKPNTKAAYIKEQVELSLKRLKTDYIDVYQTHYDDETTGIEETLRAYEDLIQAGKVRYIGASNISPDRLEESLDIAQQKELPAYISLQPEYNLYDREKFEKEYQALAAERDLAVIPYYSLASGFLSGKYLTDDDFKKSARGEGIEKRYWNDRGRKIVEALNEVAAAYRTSASAVALAWLLEQPTIAAPIASATKKEHLESFVSAIQLRLGDEALEKLNNASAY
ncbi:aldo/keto reductase [Sphingobacterium lactis]|uniref:Predicted oxidoreductase n=1 Tax=Sphingobacterium lactis TaxID=797291 RepID=A0A1H5Z7E6_9SPHI|nr:aldo/keto reductase [Sphingobacterium lactis]SEG31605.1 Predicted oxidoreductase [Sphingobacterium lactis]